MPKRNPAPHPHAIVNAQEELLKWCPNVECVLKEDLEWVCWACGESPPVREKQYRPYRCHIEQYLPERTDQPDNFILLCDRCHREQPDALTKEVLKYWLATRESKIKYDERIVAPIMASYKLLKKEFGDLLVNVAEKELLVADINAGCDSWIEQYRQNRSAGQGSGNRNANIVWVWFAEFYKWFVANKDRLELEMEKWKRERDKFEKRHHLKDHNDQGT
jgi:hypothetical protein